MTHIRLLFASLALMLAPLATVAADREPAVQSIEDTAVAHFARLALACVHQEYPNKISHVMQGDADVGPPRQLTPAFYGCFDWHSSVHGHWLLARLARLYPAADFAAEARGALQQSLADDNLEAELRYLQGPGRTSFERPYGLAWLLQLAAELHRWDDPQAQKWSVAMVPLADAAAASLATWLPKLRYPVRVGQHGQSAFAFGLVRDWAVTTGNAAMLALIDAKAREFYLVDTACPLSYEPSGEDFLSPCLAEADLMRRVLAPTQFALWLRDFLPGIPRDGGTRWLVPAEVTDRSDPMLAHLDGLNLSRAWMLRGIAAGLPEGDTRHASLINTAAAHATAALPAVTGEHYEGGHWLGTFAVYLVTDAGLESDD